MTPNEQWWITIAGLVLGWGGGMIRKPRLPNHPLKCATTRLPWKHWSHVNAAFFKAVRTITVRGHFLVQLHWDQLISKVILEQTWEQFTAITRGRSRGRWCVLDTDLWWFNTFSRVCWSLSAQALEGRGPRRWVLVNPVLVWTEGFWTELFWWIRASSV